jgi:hypothetical protein
MAIDINAKTTGVGGLETSADNSGNINIQSGGTTVMAVTSSGVDVTGDLSIGGSSLVASPSFRNLIINGDMRIAQRGTSTTSISSANTYYTVDRLKTVIGSAGTWTQTQDSSVPTGQGFAKSLKMDCTTASASLASGAYALLQYRLEGQNLQHLKKGTASAESVTLSFWVKSNKTGTYITNIEDQDNTRHICKSYTIDTADTWEKKTITYDGDTTGALDNDNGASLNIIFWIGAGSDRSSGTLATSWASNTTANRAVGQVNLADSTSNYINITGVQLEVGEGASDFEHLPYDVQLARCKRYCHVLESTSVTGRQTICSACSHTTSQGIGFLQLPVEMRVIPSLSLSAVGDWAVHMPGINRSQLTALAIGANGDQKSLYITFSHATNASYGSMKYVFIDTWSSGTGKFILSAEL